MHFSSSLQNQLTALQYGNSHEGSIEVRQALATFLSEQYKEEVLPEQLFMTGGASGGIEVSGCVSTSFVCFHDVEVCLCWLACVSR